MRLLVPNEMTFRDDWALNGFAQSFIFIHDVTVLVSPSRLKEVKFDDIDYAGIDYYPEKSGWNCECCGGRYYVNANILFPGILIDGMDNPNGLRYRMIDGRHRLDKMRLNDMTESKFFVFDYSEVKHLFYHCNTDEEKDKILKKVAEDCMHLRDTQERL